MFIVNKYLKCCQAKVPQISGKIGLRASSKLFDRSLGDMLSF